MKRLPIFILLVLIGCNAYSQQRLENDDINAVRAILKSQETAWNNADINTFMEGYWQSEKLVFVGSKGPTYGFLNTLERYKASYPNKEAMGTLNFDLLFIEQWDEKTIQVIGKFTLTRENDQPTGFFTLLFRKIDSVWKIVSDHSSSS
ncbi:MAG: YybH family protein [Flavobacteriaceae bacterium]